MNGEQFRVRRRLRVEPPYDYDYDWLSGPDPGYGFGLSGPFEHRDDDHAAAIVEFLNDVDPATGHLR